MLTAPKYYADMAFNNIPVSKLISKDYANSRRNEIQPQRAMRQVCGGNLEDGDTIYLLQQIKTVTWSHLYKAITEEWALVWSLQD